MSKETKKKVYIVVIVILALAVILTIATSGFHHKPGYYVLFGFVSKRLLGPLLQKDENYYGEAEEDACESKGNGGGH